MHFISSFSNCKNKVMLLALVIVTTLLLVLAGKRVGQRQRPGRRGELVTETAANLQVVVRDLVLNISGPSHQPWPRRPGCWTAGQQVRTFSLRERSGGVTSAAQATHSTWVGNNFKFEIARSVSGNRSRRRKSISRV